MNESGLVDGTIWRFCLAALAVWRLTHLFAEEDGPWDAIANLRARLGAGILGRLMDCFYCLSLWVSLPLAVWLGDGWMGIFMHWLALSGAACLFQRMTTPETGLSMIEPSRIEPNIGGRIETMEGDPRCAVARNEAL